MEGVGDRRSRRRPEMLQRGSAVADELLAGIRDAGDRRRPMSLLSFSTAELAWSETARFSWNSPSTGDSCGQISLREASKKLASGTIAAADAEAGVDAASVVAAGRDPPARQRRAGRPAGTKGHAVAARRNGR